MTVGNDLRASKIHATCNSLGSVSGRWFLIITSLEGVCQTKGPNFSCSSPIQGRYSETDSPVWMLS